MNCPLVNSPGFAGPLSPPPVPEVFLVLPDGSCIPATPERCRIVMRQARSAQRAQARIRRREKAVALQMAIEDRAAARSVQQDLIELARGSIRWVARVRVEADPTPPARRTSSVTKRVIRTGGGSSRVPEAPRPPSSWVIDALGLKGVIWQQSYLGRRSPGFHRGKARANWDYIVRDEAVLLDAAGESVIVSNMGDDWMEIGAGWQAMEDASIRANAKIQLLAIAPFDSDMGEGEMIAALRHFCRTVLDPLDLPYSAAIHRPPEHGDQRNCHPHIAFALRPMRRVEPYTWEIGDEVCGELDGRDGVQMLRHLWAHAMSEAAERAQSDRRYTGLGYGARGLGLETGEHLGEARAAMVTRGKHVRAHERNRIKTARNAARRAIQDADRKIAALTRVRDAALKRIAREVDVARARVIRAAPGPTSATRLVQARPVAPAAMLTDARTPAPATALSAAQPTTSATLLTSARAHEPRRPMMTPTGAPNAAMVLKAAAPVTVARPIASAATPQPQSQRLVAARTVEPAVFLRPAPMTQPTITIAPVGRIRPAAPILMPAIVPTVGRVLRSASGISSRKTLTIAPPVQPIARDIVATALFEALTLAQVARRKRHARHRAIGAHIDSLPTLTDLPTLEGLPLLDRMNADAATRLASKTNQLGEQDRARVERLRRLDPYVADYGHADGEVEIDHPGLDAIGVGWAWLRAPGVQSALRAIRDAQQRMIAALGAEVEARPLAFARIGTRFWPRDLAAGDLRRLDRWATDPGFAQDVFVLQQAIDRAHASRDAGQRPLQVADMRTPVFHDDGIRMSVAAFGPGSDTPTDQLLMLLMLAGRHPQHVTLANDGKLMAQPGAPTMLAALLHSWRGDQRVAALVTETVRASHTRGTPTWPEPIAAAMRAYVTRVGGASQRSSVHPAPDRSPSR